MGRAKKISIARTLRLNALLHAGAKPGAALLWTGRVELMRLTAGFRDLHDMNGWMGDPCRVIAEKSLAFVIAHTGFQEHAYLETDWLGDRRGLEPHRLLRVFASEGFWTFAAKKEKMGKRIVGRQVVSSSRH